MPITFAVKIIIRIIILGTYMRPISGEPEALTNTKGKNTQNKLLYMKKKNTIEYKE